MNWIIEHLDGSELHQSRDLFTINKPIYRIYFKQDNFKMGFYGDGKFFLNDIVYDFKIDIQNFKMNPIQYKTGMLVLNGTANGIHSYNIGYELTNDDHGFKYILSITFENKVIFTAEEYKGNILVNNKTKLLFGGE